MLSVTREADLDLDHVVLIHTIHHAPSFDAPTTPPTQNQKTVAATLDTMVANEEKDQGNGANLNVDSAPKRTPIQRCLVVEPTECPGLDSLTSVDGSHGDYFVGKGMGDNVPEYLQFQGRLRNLYYTKAETERMIQYVDTIVDEWDPLVVPRFRIYGALSGWLPLRIRIGWPPLSGMPAVLLSLY
jgi:hypothetical protein